MRRIILLLGIGGLLLSGSICTAQTPAALNGKIQTATDSLYTMASFWGTSFISLYNGSQQYEDLTQLRSDLQDFIDESIKDFNKTPDVGGSEKLRASLISLLEFEKNLVENGFKPFENLSSSSTDEQINSCRQKLKEISADEKNYLTKLNNERRAYVEKNGIPLVPPLPEVPRPAGNKNVDKSQIIKRPVAVKPQQAISEPTRNAEPAPAQKKPTTKEKEEADDKDEE